MKLEVALRGVYVYDHLTKYLSSSEGRRRSREVRVCIPTTFSHDLASTEGTQHAYRDPEVFYSSLGECSRIILRLSQVGQIDKENKHDRRAPDRHAGGRRGTLFVLREHIRDCGLDNRDSAGVLPLLAR